MGQHSADGFAMQPKRVADGAKSRHIPGTADELNARGLMSYRLTRLWLGAAALLALTACSSGSGCSLLALEDEKASMRATMARNIGVTPQVVEQALDTTPEQQAKVAAAITDKAKRRHGTSADVAMRQHLQTITGKLALAAGARPSDFEVVLLANVQANASTPGAGTILVNEGLLVLTRSEAQVAAVLAHEIAHVLMRHPQRQKQIVLASKAGERMMDEFTPDSLADSLGRALRLGGNATLNGMIRQQEMMADSIGIDLMVKAGYEPRELLVLFNSLQQRAPQGERVRNVVYGIHPLTTDRAKAASAKIARDYAEFTGVVTTPRFAALVRPYRSKRDGRLARR
jgi:predicted Zn-dependent protease